MTVTTSDGQHFDDEFEYWHNKIFGEQQQEEQPQGENKMFLVRHGDTPLNDANLVHGWVNTPLNDKGIEDAHKAADSLKDKNITRIVSSDLPRAKQTANIISKKLNIPVTFDPNLRTWDSGDFDYTDKHEELKKYTQTVENKKPGTSIHDMADKENWDELYDNMDALFKGEKEKQNRLKEDYPAWDTIQLLKNGKAGIRYFRSDPNPTPPSKEGIPVG